jgi:tRNA threonylcarbamoyl adenosine modification protein YjeE
VSRPAVRRVLASEAETVAAGRDLAAALRAGDLLAVDGELGAGKTCLVRGVAAGLGNDPDAVRSPTFVLHRVYSKGRITLHHIDLYRLGQGADPGVVDLPSLLRDGVVAVEWAMYAHLGEFDAVQITIESPDPGQRVLCVDGGAPARIIAALTSISAQT